MTQQPDLPRPPLPDLNIEHRTIHLKLPLPVKILAIFVLLILGTPIALNIAWVFSPAHPLSLLVIDKSSLDARGLERSSLYWALHHEKYVRSDGRFYSASTDFRGFVPVGDSAFALTGFEHARPSDIDSVAGRIDAAYFVDTYGVTKEDWNHSSSGSTRRIYGGLSAEDLRIIRDLRDRGTPVLAEFNFFASPTTDSIRHAAEQLLGIRWTGWTGRYFPSLDTLVNPELPRWIVRAHTNRSAAPWNYHSPGVVLVHANGSVVVLEQGNFLTVGVPMIVTNPDIAERFDVDVNVPYPFWFDITFPTGNTTVLSHFVLQTTKRGDSLLSRYQLRPSFPAVLRSTSNSLFFYFCMDAADNPAPAPLLALFVGIRHLRAFFYNEDDPTDRRQFYWNYYLPMFIEILHEIELRTSSRTAFR